MELPDLIKPLPMNERLFVALDAPSALQSAIIAGKVASTGVGFKLGPHNVLDDGWSALVSGLCAVDNQKFIDLKHLDIPETVKQAIAKAAQRGFSYATVHAEPDTLTAAVAAAKGTGLNVMAVLVLTSSQQPYNDSIFDTLLDRALDSGCQGAICPPDRLTHTRGLVPDTFILGSPGIRPAGYMADDHSYVGTPRQAIADGANFLVIGRPIIRASDPVGMVCRIIDEMR